MTKLPNDAPPPRVFLSYSHDTPDHAARVLELADRLREEGVNAWIDQYEQSPPEGWPRWCEKQIEVADFVLVVCTETYLARFRKKAPPGVGLGVKWEGHVITTELYETEGRNTKFVPVLLDNESLESIPRSLRSSTRYRLPEGYESLYRRVTQQPAVLAPSLGKRRALPPGERQLGLFEPRKRLWPPTVDPRRQLSIPQPAVRTDTIMFEAEPEVCPATSEQKDLLLALEAAEAKRELLFTANEDVSATLGEIRRIKRRLREGAMLSPGDLLHSAHSTYALKNILGSGGFANVWQAYDRRRSRFSAVKVLHSSLAQDRNRRDRFFRGARRMAALTHPGIVRVIEEQCEDGGFYYFVMEYLPGGDLRQAVLESRIATEQALDIVLTASEALHFAHKEGLVHRDIKPANILLDANLAPKLTDFDLVRALDTDGGTRTSSVLGSLLYLAPEALHSPKDVTAAADVYSLALTAAFVLHGTELPATAWRRPEAFIAGLCCSEDLKAVLARAVAEEPQERPNSVMDFCDSIREARVLQEISSGQPLLLGPRPGLLGSSRGLPTSEKARRLLRASEPPSGNHAPGTEWLHTPTGQLFVFIPEGEYTLGAGDLDGSSEPVHKLQLSSFWIGKVPVTNDQYLRFLASRPDTRKPEYLLDSSFNQPKQPVVGVGWEEAVAYCSWAGLELPGEAEWEAAARGKHGRRFPWGNVDPSAELANFGGLVGRPTPVGTYPRGAGSFGTLDQAGNVWEWCKKTEHPGHPDGAQARHHLHLDESGARERVLRGGSWFVPAESLASALRYELEREAQGPDVGFRCVCLARPEP